jgi:hypothetical protein
LTQAALPENVPMCRQCATEVDAQTCEQWHASKPAACAGAAPIAAEHSACQSNVLLSPSQSIYAPGETVVINFSGATGNPLDWIGLYHDDETPRTESLMWKYVGTNSQTVGPAATSGQITFDAANVPTARGYWPLTSGRTYRAFFLLNGGHRASQSTTFQIGGDPGTSSGGAGGTGPIGAHWTGWLNRDTPEGLGDSEQRTLFNTVCEHPIDFEARVVGTHVAYFETGERLVASTDFGIECRNVNQPDERCENYEINFLCPEKWPVPGIWSNWTSWDNPTGVADNEQLSARSAASCRVPWAIEATTISEIDYTLTGDFLRIEPDFGLLCENKLQPDGTCNDYRVRFFCPTSQ